MQNTDVEYAEFVEALATALGRDSRIAAVYLHGSFGTDSCRPDSDVDCALLLYPEQTMTSLELMSMAGELSGRLRVTLDMGLLTSHNLVYFVQAVQNGTRIFCRDAALVDSLVARAFSLYARLKEDRREVEMAYHAA